ncbi:hypothetical protein ABPG75_001021 [Micractinium tetrahymenae]
MQARPGGSWGAGRAGASAPAARAPAANPAAVHGLEATPERPNRIPSEQQAAEWAEWAAAAAASAADRSARRERDNRQEPPGSSRAAAAAAGAAAAGAPTPRRKGADRGGVIDVDGAVEEGGGSYDPAGEGDEEESEQSELFGSLVDIRGGPANRESLVADQPANTAFHTKVAGRERRKIDYQNGWHEHTLFGMQVGKKYIPPHLGLQAANSQAAVQGVKALLLEVRPTWTPSLPGPSPPSSSSGGAAADRWPLFSCLRYDSAWSKMQDVLENWIKQLGISLTWQAPPATSHISTNFDGTRIVGSGLPSFIGSTQLLKHDFYQMGGKTGAPAGSITIFDKDLNSVGSWNLGPNADNSAFDPHGADVKTIASGKKAFDLLVFEAAKDLIAYTDIIKRQTVRVWDFDGNVPANPRTIQLPGAQGLIDVKAANSHWRV